MSKHFSANITILDTGHFIDFNIHPYPTPNPELLFGILVVFIHQTRQRDYGNNEKSRS